MKKGVIVNIVVVGLIALFVIFVVFSLKEQPLTTTAISSDESCNAYTLGGSINTDGDIRAITISDGLLCVATDNSLSSYNEYNVVSQIKGDYSKVNDISISKDTTFLVFDNRVTMNISDKEVATWVDERENVRLTSIAKSKDKIFISDANNRVIRIFDRYNLNAKGIITRDFVVPSYIFDVAVNGDTLYCVNPGKHTILRYTFEGEYLGSTAKQGDFAGCCNPASIAVGNSGEIITAEKGISRVQKFIGDSSHELFTAKTAINHIELIGNNIIIATKDKIDIFVPNLNNDQCSTCTKECPLNNH